MFPRRVCDPERRAAQRLSMRRRLFARQPRAVVVDDGVVVGEVNVGRDVAPASYIDAREVIDVTQVVRHHVKHPLMLQAIAQLGCSQLGCPEPLVKHQ